MTATTIFSFTEIEGFQKRKSSLVSFYVATGSATGSDAYVDAWVEDSEGNVYTPYNVWISYYGWRGW